MSKSDDNQAKWLNEFLEATKGTEWATKLTAFLGSEEQLRLLFPTDIEPEGSFTPTKGDDGKRRVFEAFRLLSPIDVEYLVIGLDPYPDEKLATGVAFLVPEDSGKPTPPSLKHLTECLFPKNEPNLVKWSQDNGVLLINAALTFPIGGKISGAHLPDWTEFTKAIIRFLKMTKPDIEIIALGKDAANVAKEALIRCCIHPAARGLSKDRFREDWGDYGPYKRGGKG